VDPALPDREGDQYNFRNKLMDKELAKKKEIETIKVKEIKVQSQK